MTKSVTLKQLQEHGACTGQQQLFRKLFPKGRVALSHSLVINLAHAFDMEWVADNVLTSAQRAFFYKRRNELNSANSRQFDANVKIVRDNIGEYDRAHVVDALRDTFYHRRAEYNAQALVEAAASPRK